MFLLQIPELFSSFSFLPVLQQLLISLFPEEFWRCLCSHHALSCYFNHARYWPDWNSSSSSEPGLSPGSRVRHALWRRCLSSASLGTRGQSWMALFLNNSGTAGMSSLVLEAGPGSASCRWPATKRGITDFWNLLLVSQGSAPFLGQIKTTQSRLNCLDFWICFCLFFFHFLLQSNWVIFTFLNSLRFHWI